MLAAAACFCAGVPAQPPLPVEPTAPAASAAADDGMTQGDVRNVDRAARTVTLRDDDGVLGRGRPAALDALKVDDRVRFRIEKTVAGLVVTRIGLAQ